MEHQRFGHTILLTVPPGEEVVQALNEVAEIYHISLAEVSGIGGVDQVKLGFYQLDTQEYLEQDYEGIFEMLSLMDNITLKDGEIFGHYHGQFADTSADVFGGHLLASRVFATAELFIRDLGGAIDRSEDPETGIEVIAFEE